MAGVKRKISCKELFKKFDILLSGSEFLVQLLLTVVDNTANFQKNSDITIIVFPDILT
jgi:hypothetical protein